MGPNLAVPPWFAGRFSRYCPGYTGNLAYLSFTEPVLPEQPRYQHRQVRVCGAELRKCFRRSAAGSDRTCHCVGTTSSNLCRQLTSRKSGEQSRGKASSTAYQRITRSVASTSHKGRTRSTQALPRVGLHRSKPGGRSFH